MGGGSVCFRPSSSASLACLPGCECVVTQWSPPSAYLVSRVCLIQVPFLCILSCIVALSTRGRPLLITTLPTDRASAGASLLPAGESVHVCAVLIQYNSSSGRQCNFTMIGIHVQMDLTVDISSILARCRRWAQLAVARTPSGSDHPGHITPRLSPRNAFHLIFA